MDDKTLLYRQVNPKFIKNDLATTQHSGQQKKTKSNCLSMMDQRLSRLKHGSTIPNN